jgi:hypothetical protein
MQLRLTLPIWTRKTADAAYENAGYRRNRHNASRLKTNETVVARVLELQANQQERFVLTRQYTIEALVENTEKALGRHPVKIGADGNEEFVYAAMLLTEHFKCLVLNFRCSFRRAKLLIENMMI